MIDRNEDGVVRALLLRFMTKMKQDKSREASKLRNDADALRKQFIFKTASGTDTLQI